MHRFEVGELGYRSWLGIGVEAMSEGQPIGIVAGDSRPDTFVFSVDPSYIPPLYDYVYVELEEIPPGEPEPRRVKVVAQIRNIRRVSIGLSPEHPWPVLKNLSMPHGNDTVIAVAKVLGYKWKGRIYYPRRAPPVGSWVYLADDKLLEDFYSVDEERRLWIGYLVSRPTVRAYLDVEGLKRHMAIIAATGAGKTWTSIVLIEELLKKGATVLVLDPHGEYVAIKRSITRLGTEYADRVVVLKGRKDQEGDILYRVSVLDLSEDELATIAGVPSRATRIRAVIGGAKRVATQLAKLLGRPNLAGLKGIRNIIGCAIDAVEMVKMQSRKLEDYTRQFLRQLSLTLGLGDKSEELKMVAADEMFQRSIRRLWLALRKDTEPGYDAIRYIEELRKIGVYGVKPIRVEEFLKPGTVTIFNLAGLRTEVQDHLVYNILTRVFMARVRYIRGLKGEVYPYPVIIVMEEAHKFIPPKTVRQTRTREIATIIASEGRKFGVHLIAITQRPSRVDQDILSQMQSQIVLRIVNPRDQDAVRDAGEQLSQDLLENLPGLNTGEAVIVGPVVPAPIMVRVRDRVLDYSGADLILVKEWMQSFEAEKLAREYAVEAALKLSRILGGAFNANSLDDALTKLIGRRVKMSTVHEALLILARGHVWASYDELNGVVAGEADGVEVKVVLQDGLIQCSLCGQKACAHAVAVVLRAVLDDLLSMPRTGEPWEWWYKNAGGVED